MRFLFRPAWDSKDWYRAVKAVKKIKDEAKLERIAKEARCWDARQAAVERLTGQSLLVDIAWNDEDSDVCAAAVKRLADQSILADIARNHKNWFVRRTATGRLTDQNLLAVIARNDEDNYVRMIAVERVTDQSLLADVARNDKEDIRVRIAASHRLVTYDLEEDLLTYIIHMLGGVLKNTDNRLEKEEAREALLSFYRRYRKEKQGKEIRMYRGRYEGGHSDHSDKYEDNCHAGICYDGEHTDDHTDTKYTMNFNPIVEA
jgi:hypothetical protein